MKTTTDLAEKNNTHRLKNAADWCKLVNILTVSTSKVSITRLSNQVQTNRVTSRLVDGSTCPAQRVQKRSVGTYFKLATCSRRPLDSVEEVPPSERLEVPVSVSRAGDEAAPPTVVLKKSAEL